MITFLILSSVFITILIRQILKDRKEYFECHSINDKYRHF